MPGIYQEYRITSGLALWPNYGSYLWVAGTNGDPAYSREQIVAVTGTDSDRIICGGYARHTPDQMIWCRDLLKVQPQVKHLIVTTAAYHVVRCTLTLLKVLNDADVRIPITPMPLRNPGGDSFSPTGTENFQLEIEKILKYQVQGYVASFEAWREYLAWRIGQ